MDSNISSLLEQSIQSFKIANFKKTKLLLLKVLELQSNNFDAIHLLGVLSGIEDNHHKAFNYFKVAIKIKPKNHFAHYNLAKALSKLGNDTEAIEHYSISIKLKSDYAKAWNNKGVSLSKLKQYEEALFNYDQAIKLKSDYAEAWNNKGVSLSKLKKYEEALFNYDQAIKLKSDYAEAFYGKAETKLILGDFQDGWNLYRFRWKKEDFEIYRYSQFKKLESTNNLKNKKILIWHEQGFGDIIQFSRYIPELINLGAIITFEVPKDLISFFKKQFDCEVTDRVSTNQLFDYQAPLLNLPFLFKTLINTIPLNQSYLKAQEKIIDWKEKLKLSKTKLNVGIAVSGNPDYPDNHIRSIPLEKMKSLFQQANFFIIQKELDTKDKFFLEDSTDIKFLGDGINNFLDTAAIVENMDLIISINTSLIHLAGALGKKSFLLLSWASEWRWLIDRRDSPWYKSIKIFRQKFIDDWDSVINEIQFELSKLK